MLLGLWSVIYKFLGTIKAKTWLYILYTIFIFALGASIMHGCDKPKYITPPPPQVTIKWDTLPTPPAVIDTFYKDKIVWKHDTIWISDTIGDSIESKPSIMDCEHLDTITPAGTSVKVKQCFKPLITDSLLNALIQPMTIDIQEPKPVIKVVDSTKTVIKDVPKTSNSTLTILEDAAIMLVGILLGSKL